MPKLSCEVRNCAYNYNRLCTRGAIDVEGPTSRRKRETSCLSFVSRDIESFNYEIAHFGAEEDGKTEIYCDAIYCVYEKGSKCHADRVHITNVDDNRRRNISNEANQPLDTMCKTFESQERK